MGIRQLIGWSALLLAAGVAAAAGPAPLIEAAKSENLVKLQELLDAGGPANQTGPDGTSALHWMVRAENPEMVDRLLEAGADVNLADSHGVTPLYLAILLANEPLTTKLLGAGADPNAVYQFGENLLMLAVHIGDRTVVQDLLNAGADVNFVQEPEEATALMLAVREGHPGIVRLLLETGADVNRSTVKGEKPPRRPAGAGGGSHGVGIIRGGVPAYGSQTPASGGMTALLYAARDGQTEMTSMLLDAGANIDRAEVNHITPLQIAVANGNFETAAYLLVRGADVNSADNYGRTPLWLATEFRNLDIGRSGDEHHNLVGRDAAMTLIRQLLDAGANVDARTTDYPPVRRYLRPLGDFSWVNIIGQTPFFRAALSGDVELMRLLLEHGADPNIETDEGSTALMAAAGINWVYQQTYTVSAEAALEAVKLCVEQGADVNHTNSMGLAAVHGAANRGSNDIIQYLHAQGADLTMPDKEGRTPYVWAQGVFLATNGAIEKPETMAVIQELTGETAAE